jgi:uncharacterized protein
MSEQQNVEAVTRMYEAFGRGDIQYIVDQLADEIRWVSHLDAAVPWHGVYVGKTEVPRFFDAINRSVDVTAFVPREFVSEGDTVVSIGESGCTVRATGEPSHSRWIVVWKLRDGKVYSYEQFHEPALGEAFRRRGEPSATTR